MRGIILYLTSLILSIIVFPLAIISLLIVSIRKAKSLRHFWRMIDNHFRMMAISRDMYANVWGKYFFNITMIKSNGYKFGNRKETISSVYGKNLLKNTLLWLGIKINNILNKLDPNHSIKSIDKQI